MLSMRVLPPVDEGIATAHQAPAQLHRTTAAGQRRRNIALHEGQRMHAAAIHQHLVARHREQSGGAVGLERAVEALCIGQRVQTFMQALMPGMGGTELRGIGAHLGQAALAGGPAIALGVALHCRLRGRQRGIDDIRRGARLPAPGILGQRSLALGRPQAVEGQRPQQREPVPARHLPDVFQQAYLLSLGGRQRPESRHRPQQHRQHQQPQQGPAHSAQNPQHNIPSLSGSRPWVPA